MSESRVREQPRLTAPGQSGPGEIEERADVQGLSDADLTVYEAVATVDQTGDVAEFDYLKETTGLPEDDLREALRHLLDANHVSTTPGGYALGPHDWSVWQ